MRAIFMTILVLAAMGGTAPAQNTQPPIFRFETGEFWLNLHHFLYVLGRAQAKLPDATRASVVGAPDDAARGLAALTASERAQWAAAVSEYAKGLSLKDAVFDEPLPALTALVATFDDTPSISAVGEHAASLAILARAAPIYRKAWWPAHRAVNEAWAAAMAPLLARHGPAVLAYITRAYGMAWPEGGYPVHLSAWVNWAGAYSTTGDLLVVSTLDPESTGLHGMETLFHEGMHQWDDEMFSLVREHTRKLGKLVPRNLTHAIIFFTAGEAVRSVVSAHTPFADAAGIWNRGMAPFKLPLEQVWKPWLAGRGTRDEALAALAARTAVAR